MDIEIREEFKKLIYSFFRDNNLKKEDMSKLLRSALEYFSTEHAKPGKSWLDMRKKLSEGSIKDFSEMWDSFVQQSIDFVNNHDDVKSLIESEKKELSEEWNKDIEEGEFKMTPDVRLSFGIDGMDESIKAGKWVSATDSAISLSVGNRDLIEMM